MGPVETGCGAQLEMSAASKAGTFTDTGWCRVRGQVEADRTADVRASRRRAASS
jgi:hypothetical protein